jgi:uncharacterized protein YbjT (DUF2867 family)
MMDRSFQNSKDTQMFNPPSSEVSRPRIAVAGATGRVGATLIANLVNDPVDIVALTRNPDTRDLPAGVALAKVDFDIPATLAGALRGVERLFLSHGTSPRQVANEIALIDAAVAAGVVHIVKLSVMGPPSRLHPFDWHMQIEAHLAAHNIGYTLLRPSSFVDILARASAPVADGSWGGVAGNGRVNFIDTRDVADAARAALLDNEHIHSQRAYHLTGPGTVSMPEVAEELSRLLGETVLYQHRTHDEHRGVLIASGVSEMVADLLLGLDGMFRESVLAETTSTFSELTGQTPRSVAGWLSDNIAVFRKKSEPMEAR